MDHEENQPPKNYLYSNHAVQQLFRRRISTEAVEKVICNGKTIKAYPDDLPYPSKLVLGFIDGRPLHVVYSVNSAEATTIIITAYEPTTDIWENDFTTRKT